MIGPSQQVDHAPRAPDRSEPNGTARGSEIVDDGALPRRLEEAHHQLERATREYPYLSLAVAAGVGMVLGGGLPSWAARLVVMSGARVAAARWVDALLPPSRSR